MRKLSTFGVFSMSALLLVAATTALPSGQAAVPLFTESWNNCFTGWTVSGSTATCDTSDGSPAAPSIRLNPTSSTPVRVYRDPAAAGSGVMEISFNFKGSSLFGDTDSQVNVAFTNGGWLTLGITEGIGNNNGLTLITSSGSHVNFGSWPAADTWFEAKITLNLVAGTAVATAAGATSNVLGFPTGHTGVSNVEFYSVQWNSDEDVLHKYDELVIATV